MEEGYAKCWAEGMCKVCIVMKGGEFGLKVSDGNGVMAGACF